MCTMHGNHYCVDIPNSVVAIPYITRSFTNKVEYFAQNYDHIFNTRNKSKTFQNNLHKTKL